MAADRERRLPDPGHNTYNNLLYTAPWANDSIVFPIVAHGFFSIAELYMPNIMRVVFYVFLAVLYLVSFVLIYSVSMSDVEDEKAVRNLLNKKYSDLIWMSNQVLEL